MSTLFWNSSLTPLDLCPNMSADHWLRLLQKAQESADHFGGKLSNTSKDSIRTVLWRSVILWQAGLNIPATALCKVPRLQWYSNASVGFATTSKRACTIRTLFSVRRTPVDTGKPWRWPPRLKRWLLRGKPPSSLSQLKPWWLSAQAEARRTLRCMLRSDVCLLHLTLPQSSNHLIR